VIKSQLPSRVQADLALFKIKPISIPTHNGLIHHIMKKHMMTMTMMTMMMMMT
jgi:hypothetical protein